MVVMRGARIGTNALRRFNLFGRCMSSDTSSSGAGSSGGCDYTPAKPTMYDVSI